MILCFLFYYHILYGFPAAQIRKLPKSDAEPRGRQTSVLSCHRRKGIKKTAGKAVCMQLTGWITRWRITPPPTE
ncbi:hypothetical protein EKN81_20165 [Enterobacter asburiae]|nr:hypothetical protein EKN81_20165 [Enterobacter asburiae]RTP74203.1 hypothetical protein EKN32_20165 [Enterobacter asburiae]